MPPRANTFYALTPQIGQPDRRSGDPDRSTWSISAIAAFIASQALITGMFSIVKQAIALGFSPRFEVQFTSRRGRGPGLHPGGQLGDVRRLRGDHADLPLGGQPGRGLRDRRDRDDGHHDAGLRLRGALPLGVGAGPRGGRLRADPGGGPAVLRQQPAEVPHRRLHPGGDRLRARHGDADVAVGPGAARAGVLRVRRPGRQAGRLARRPAAEGR